MQVRTSSKILSDGISDSEKRSLSQSSQPGNDLFMEESFSTKYSQFLRDLENYDHNQIDTDEDACESLLPDPKCDKEEASRFHGPDFLTKLKQTLQRCQQDSDSDSDIISLQKCLEKNLLDDTRNYNEETNLMSEQSLNELDVAQLTINLTEDTISSFDDIFEATYVPPNKQAKASSAFHDLSSANITRFSNGSCVTLNSMAESGDGFRCESDADCTLTDSVIIVAEKNKSNLICDKNSDKKEREIDRIDKEQKEFSMNITAPWTISKPDECKTSNLIKAPKKMIPYIERCVANNPLLKEPSSKLFDGFTKTLTLNSKSSRGVALPKRINPVTSVPETPHSHRGIVGKTVPSISSSCQSYFSVVEEFIYEDAEAGVALIERRCPTSSSIARYVSISKQLNCLF